MGSGGESPPVPPEEGARRKKVLVLVIGLIILVAAIGTVSWLVFFRGAGPAPSSVSGLDHVVVTASATSVYQGGKAFSVSAAAFDTAGIDQTSNASINWSAAPSNAVTLAPSGATTSVTPVRGGTVTITANAAWKGTSKSGSASVSITAVSFLLTPSSLHPVVPPSGPASVFILDVKAVTGTNTPYTGYTGKVHFTSNDSGATLPPDTSFTLADAGDKALTNLTITHPGAVSISVTDVAFPISGTTTVYGNRVPVPSFQVTWNPSDPRQITLNATGSYDPDPGETLSYGWTFGDNANAVGATTSHTYATAGTYIISLTVTDNWGGQNTTTQSYLAHSPPVADFHVFKEQANGALIEVEMDASASTGGDGSITYYNWTWGDGAQSQTINPMAFHNYTSSYNGQTVTATLRVANNYSLSDSASRSFTVTTQKLPPVAAFTTSIAVGPVINQHVYRTLTVNASGSSSPIGAALVYFNWTWGDGSGYTNTTNPVATHVYAVDGTYPVNLTVVDSNGLTGSVAKSVVVYVAPAPPVAFFTDARSLMTVSTDANGSYDPNNDIGWYNWAWGDGSPITNTTQPWAAHTYATPGYYTLVLTVIDTTGLRGTYTGWVSVAHSTLDYTFHDFFNVSYGDWWDMRPYYYGDQPVESNCFNASAVNEKMGNRYLCTVTNPSLPNGESYPYTNWYPSPVVNQLHYTQPGVDPLFYAPYRFRAIGANVPGYNVSEPVFLPVLNYSVQPSPSSYINFQWNMQYLSFARWQALNGQGCVPSPDDGFMLLSWINATMDLQESKRIFRVPAGDSATQAQTWWNSNSGFNCATYSSYSIDNALHGWFQTEGNGKYDAFSSFQYPYTPFFTIVRATVASDGTTRVTIGHSAWATEVLFARWSYWGNTSYEAHYLDSSTARGWWGMELAWFEGMNYSGSLYPSPRGMDFSLESAMQYHFSAGATGGPDGYLNQKNDVPTWTWGPDLTDYITSPQHVSELSRYGTQTYLHSTPGEYNYNKSVAYDYTPVSWYPKLGEEWHFQFPKTSVAFFDPNNATIPQNPISYTPRISRPLAFAGTYPSQSTWTTFWDSGNMTWDVFGGAPSTASWPCNCPGGYPSAPWGSIIFVPNLRTAVAQTPSMSPLAVFQGGTTLLGAVPAALGPASVSSASPLTAGVLIAVPELISGRPARHRS